MGLAGSKRARLKGPGPLKMDLSILLLGSEPPRPVHFSAPWACHGLVAKRFPGIHEPARLALVWLARVMPVSILTGVPASSRDMVLCTRLEEREAPRNP